jgi:hypothetical protein
MQRTRRWWAGIAALAVLAGTVVTGIGGHSTAVAAEGSGPKTVIQIGDSFASGEGAGWKGNSGERSGNREGTDDAAKRLADGSFDYWPVPHVYETGTFRARPSDPGNTCHRGKYAPITWVRAEAPEVSKVINVACSGAQAKHVWPVAGGGQGQHSGVAPQLTQIDQLISPSDDVELVSVSIGGNDLNLGSKPGFGQLVKDCVRAYLDTYVLPGYDAKWCKDAYESTAGDAVSDVYYNLSKTVDLVRQTLSANGQPPGTYKLVLNGYPSITPSAWDDWSPMTELSHDDYRCPVRRFDSSWINRHLVTRLNDIIQSVAEDKGTGFIDLRDAFDGHRLCESGTSRGSIAGSQPQKAEWVRYLDADFSDSNLVAHLVLSLLGFTSDEESSAILGSQRSIAESFHPNYYGQRALGHCLHVYYASVAANSLHRCFVGGVGPYDHPDFMTLGPLAAKSKVNQELSPDLPIGNPLTRSLTVPAAVPAGHYIQPQFDITHARKGQLKVTLTSPQGEVFLLKNYNSGDTGAWGNGGRFTRNHLADPSGTWILRIWDNDPGSYQGTLNRWDLKTF